MTIKTVKNIALIVSLAAFAIGFSDGGESMFWYLGRPVGAILFGAFLIFMVLEKETALLDEQRRVAKEESDKLAQTESVPRKHSNKENCAPALTTATSH